MKEFNSNLENYIDKPGSFEELNLVASGALRLHWANWGTLVTDLKERVETEGESETLDQIEVALKEFKSIPVWFINKQGQIKSSVYELYSYFLDPRLRELWFELNEETLISFQSASGPFIRLQSMRWFDFNIYKNFVLHKLLQDNGLRTRSFRLSVDIPTTCRFTNNIDKEIDAEITQVSSDGFLLKVEGKYQIEQLKKNPEVEFSASFAPFIKAKGKGLIEVDRIFNAKVFTNKSTKRTTFSLKKNIIHIGPNFKNCGYSNGQEFYLFISFNDIEDFKEKKKIVESIKYVVDLFETQACEVLSKSAA